MSFGSYNNKKQNQNKEKYRDFSDNRKRGSNPQPYRKKNNIFQVNKNFNKTGTKPCVRAPNGNKQVSSGANATPLAIKCWKCNGMHYAQDCKNKNSGFLYNLQEEPTIENIAGTLQIYETSDGRQADHQATMVKIEGKILNTYASILIDPGAYWSYVAPNIVDLCKLGKVKHVKPCLV